MERHPALILAAPFKDILLAIPTAFAGIVALSGAMEGYFWGIGQLTWVARALFFGAGVLLVIPGWRTDLCGIGIVGLVFVFHYLLPKTGIRFSRYFPGTLLEKNRKEK